MHAEDIISLMFNFITAFIMIGIGISQIKSINPVGFYTGQKPPKEKQLTDVKEWNKKHGIMWIIYGFAIMSSFFVGIFVGDSFYSAMTMMGVVFGGLLFMIWYHGRLKNKYLK